MKLFAVLAALLPTVVQAQLPAFVAPTLPRYQVDVALPPAPTRVIRVPAGDAQALQAALDTSRGGDAIVLPNRSAFTGNFQLKPHVGGVVVLRSDSMPPAGMGVDPAFASVAATLIAPTGQAALETTDQANDWRVIGIRVTISPTSIDNYGMVVLGSSVETTQEQLPRRIVLDRVLVDGGSSNTSRCVSLNGAAMAVIHSWLVNCHAKGRDAQAIAGWSGPGPFLIRGNHLEASGEVIMFGGSDARIPGLTPSDITIDQNVLTRPLSYAGVWTVKNLLELKHAQYVLVSRNDLSNNWADAQVGFAVLFQTVNQDGSNPWAVISDVTVQHNVIRNSTHGINLLSRFNTTTAPMRRVLVWNNAFVNVGTDPISNTAIGRYVQLLSDLNDVTLVQNSFQGVGAQTAVLFDGGPMLHLVIANNAFDQTSYGLIGTGVGVGQPAVTASAPGAVVQGNAFVGQPGAVYPEGNSFPATFAGVPATAFGVRVGANIVDPPVVVTPPPVLSLPRDCSQAPVGYAIMTRNVDLVVVRRELTTVTRGDTCIGVVTLGSTTRYQAHVRECTTGAWISLLPLQMSRLKAQDLVKSKECPLR